MGLDVKEKNLLRFLLKFLLPSALLGYFFITYVFKGDILRFVGFCTVTKIAFKLVLMPVYRKLTRKTKVSDSCILLWVVLSG